MWGGVCVTSLFPRDGPIFRDDVLSNPEFQVNLKFANYEIFEAWNELEQEKPSSQKRDMAYWILTESGLADEFAREFPNGNLILREDYQRSFKAVTRYRDTQLFLKK